MTAAAPPLPPRHRLWLRTSARKTVAVVAAAVGLAAALWEAAYVATERRVAQALAYSDRFGLPRTLEELVGPPIDPDRNAATALFEATKIATEEIAKSPDFRATSYSVTASMLVEPARLYGNERYQALIRAADERPAYRSLAADDDECPTYEAYQRLMGGCRFLSAELAIGRWLGEQGRPKEAVERLLRLLRLGRKWGDHEPTFWAAIMQESVESSACYWLALNLRKGALPPSVHEAIEVELAQSLDYSRTALRGMQAEKLQVLGFCDAYGLTPPSLPFRPLRNLDKLYALDYFNRSMENMTLSPAEVRPAQLQLESAHDALKGSLVHQSAHPVSVKYLPSFENLVLEWRHPLVMARCTRVLNAMVRQGRMRADLDSLGLPPQCLTDPFDGKRLRVKNTESGPAIYSVGRNLVDDGGDYKEYRDVGVWPPLPEAKK